MKAIKRFFIKLFGWFSRVTGGIKKTVSYDTDEGVSGIKDPNNDMLMARKEKLQDERILPLLNLKKDLRSALHKEEFFLYYQPIIDLKSGKISGMEALIRWKHPEFGVLTPANFLPLAEAAGLLVPISEWSMNEACSEASLLAKKEVDFSPLKICINLSSEQFYHNNSLIITIDNILESTGIQPSSLELEFPEAIFSPISGKVIFPIMEQLSERGINLTVDDFGTGVSRMQDLKKMKINMIKIENSHIKNINNNEQDRKYLAAILVMASNLGIKTLAEGVETKKQLQFLKDKNCNFIQGFYFSKPISIEKFTQLMANNKIYKI